MLTAQKSLKQKILKKLYSLRSVFSIFLLQDFPPTIAPFLLIMQKEQKSENPGHMRPRPWKSCHPREEK
jgi:hypothetical protein